MNICSTPGRLFLLTVLVALIGSQAVAQQTNSARSAARDRFATSKPEAGGIHEVIPEKYAKRYQEWKTEFLATDIGKAQWEMYSKHPYLQLTITVGSRTAPSLNVNDTAIPSAGQSSAERAVTFT